VDVASPGRSWGACGHLGWEIDKDLAEMTGAFSARTYQRKAPGDRPWVVHAMGRGGQKGEYMRIGPFSHLPRVCLGTWPWWCGTTSILLAQVQLCHQKSEKAPIRKTLFLLQRIVSEFPWNCFAFQNSIIDADAVDRNIAEDRICTMLSEDQA